MKLFLLSRSLCSSWLCGSYSFSESSYGVFLLRCPYSGRRGGLMVSALDSGSGGPGSSPGWVRALAGALRCVLGQDTLLS